MKGSFHLARIAGIDLFLHWTWFLVLVYEVQARAGAYSSLAWNVLEVVVLFAIVTLHEFGHASACRQVGGIANRILLWPFGGIAYVDVPPRPGATLWTLAAGPLVNVVLIPVLGYLQSQALRAAVAAGQRTDLLTFCHALVYINLGLLVFNILPIYPLDGGQILHALLWYPLGRARSLLVTTVLGFVGVAGLMYAALRMSDLLLFGITIFILLYCWKGLQYGRRLWTMGKLQRHEGFACPWCRLPPPEGALWRCGLCHEAYDPFSTACVCPHCHAHPTHLRCLDCGHLHSWLEWSTGAVIDVPSQA